MTDGPPPDDGRMADDGPTGDDRGVGAGTADGRVVGDEHDAGEREAAGDADDGTSGADVDRAAGAGDADGAPTPVVRYVGDDPERTAGAGSDATAGQGTTHGSGGTVALQAEAPEDGDVPADVRKYDRFKKIDGGTYDRANEFLRERTYITAREWAIARLCADFRTETGVEMTKIGENLPELVPFMTDTYTPQAVNQARASFEGKVRKSGATFLYGAMCDFFTAEELDDVMYEATEVAKFLLEVEGVELSVDEELEAEDRISSVMREVREHSAALRHDEVSCPECGHEFEAGGE